MSNPSDYDEQFYWMPDDYRASDVYEYRDESGATVFGVSRASELDEQGHKVFRQWRADPGSRTGRKWSLSWTDEAGKKHKVRQVPFELPRVLRAVAAGEVIYIAEGEKDVLALERAGVTATCNAGGAGKWARVHAKYLEGASTVIIADKDGPGWSHARTVAATLDGVAATVRVVCAAEGKDASDHLDAGHAVADLVPVDMSAPQPDWARGAASNSGPAKSSGEDQEPEQPAVDAAREDGAAILAETEQAWRRYVVWGSDHEPVALTLWTVHTHAFEAADATGYPDVSSPMPESGKTLVLELAELLVARGWLLTKPTIATLYRKIAQDAPTILLDEYDTLWGGKAADGNEDLRGVFDSGYRRGGSVPRCVGEGTMQTVVDFPVFCPKMLAGIGNTLPRTITTRTIPVRLRRKKKSEKVSRFRNREARAVLLPLRDRLAAWGELMTGELRDARPVLPGALTDRQQDIWEPLLAIADAAGGDWPKRARDAALAIHAGKDDAGTGELLLQHVYEAFVASGGAMYLSTENLLRALISRDDGPWADMWEKALAEIPSRIKGPAARLAKLLKSFGVTPEPIGVGAHGQVRGYRLQSFADAWERYGIPGTPAPRKMRIHTQGTQGRRSGALLRTQGRTTLLAS